MNFKDLPGGHPGHARPPGTEFSVVPEKNDMEQPRNTLILSSPEFVENGVIPVKFSCKGEGISPTLVIDQVPEDTQSMVLILEDPDTAHSPFTHWVLFDILPANSINENSEQGLSGLNDSGEIGYTPPCPPSGIHRYYFHVFALDRALDLRPGSSREEVETAMRPHILASGSLMGRFGEGAIQEAREEGHGGAERTTVDETGAGAWTADKKAEH